jgi:hypothetical protein
VWNDLDGDGQREAGEPPISSGPEGVQVLRLIPQSIDPLPTVDGVVAADGTYSVTVRPGQYLLQVWVDGSLFMFSPPNVGDDATDSDLVFFEGDPGVNVGTTDVVVNLEGGSLRPVLMPGSFSSNLPSLGRCLRRLQPDEQRCRAKVLCAKPCGFPALQGAITTLLPAPTETDVNGARKLTPFRHLKVDPLHVG